MTASGAKSSGNGLALVIVAGLVVVGAGAAGWFLFNKSEPAATADSTAEPPPLAEKPAPELPAPSPTVDGEATVTPTKDPVPAKDRPTREYYVDGKLIRDHRREGTPPMDLPPVIRPPDARKLKATSTTAVTSSVRAVMQECVSSIPPEERTGDKPKMEAVVVIGVKDKVAKVTKATVQLRDVRGSATDAAKSCIENKVLGVSEGVDELDLESYDITTSFRF